MQFFFNYLFFEKLKCNKIIIKMEKKERNFKKKKKIEKKKGENTE